MYEGIDLLGQSYDKLIVIALAERTISGKKWLCRCVCGNEVLKLTTQLRRLRLQEKFYIGCKACERISRSDPKIKHGGCRLGKSRLYQTWKAMRNRCSNPNTNIAKYYFLKGIQVCEEWNSFEVFRDWASRSGYMDNLTIDRVNPMGNYEPNNCEWVTRSENSRRMMATRKVTQ